MDRVREWQVPVSINTLMVSNLGEVYNIVTEQMVCIGDNGRGYKQIVITVDGKCKKYYVHRLVAEAFVPNPNGYKEVNHLDGNKANNSPDNLEWCTRSQNLLHAYRTGLKARTTPRQLAAAMRNLEKAWKMAAA